MAFIIKPLVTEKMTKITDKQPNRYGFVVRPEANKLEIKKEVESLYNVTVVDVYLSARNLQRSEVILASNVNSYKILNADVVVITEKSLETIDQILTK